MAKSTQQKIRETGLTDEQVRTRVTQKGLDMASKELGVSVESLEIYAKDHLEMANPPLYVPDAFKSNSVLEREFIFEMYAIWKELMAERDQLRAELEKQRQAEAHKEALAKSQLMEMLSAVRSQ